MRPNMLIAGTRVRFVGPPYDYGEIESVDPISNTYSITLTTRDWKPIGVIEMRVAPSEIEEVPS